MGKLSKIAAAFMGGVAKGDMQKSVYDTGNNGVVDNSEKLEGSTKVQVQDHTPKAHTLASHSTKAHNELSGIDADVHGDIKLRTKEVDETNIGDGKVPTYRTGSGKLEYETPAGGGPTIVVGTYTGDGNADREINIGGEAKFGMVQGPRNGGTETTWFLMKGIEAKWTYPTIYFIHNTPPGCENSEAFCTKASTNGFTLAHAAGFDNNVNGNTYYYVMFRD